MALTAAVMGKTSAMERRAVGSAASGTSSPQSSNWGKMKAGMNCTAWNSEVASALSASPKAVPRRPAHSATALMRQGTPWWSSPYQVYDSVETRRLCNSAMRPKAAA